MQVLVVIPARMNSSRFPGKALALIAGRSLILRVCDRAKLIPCAIRLLVATDDERILEHVKTEAIEAVMTSPDHASGSERVAEAAGGWEGLILNLQGDEPLADPQPLGRLIDRMRRDTSIEMGTVASPLAPGDLENPDRVKVLVDPSGRAVDFLRLPAGSPPRGLRLLRHAGVYLFRAETLRAYVASPSCERERDESLEQLRALEIGMRIHVEECEDWAPGVDRPSDVKVIELRLEGV